MKSSIRLLTAVLFSALIAMAYIVQDGDTLWDISETHLQNPFLWPDVWERNPHIVNPHLIYPGDSIALDTNRRSTGLLAIEPMTPGEDSLTRKMISASSGPRNADDDFLNKTKVLKKQPTKSAQRPPAQLYISGSNDTIPRHLNRYMQASAPRLLLPEHEKRLFQSEWFFDFEDQRHSLTLRNHDYAILDAGSREKLKPGDLLELFPLTDERIELTRDDLLTKWAPYSIFAYAEVVHVAKNKSRIKILATYGAVDPVKCRARKADLPVPLEVKSYQKVTSYKRSEMAEVVYHHTKLQPIANYGWISIGRGLKQGFNPGDGVAIWEAGHEKNKGLPPRQLASGIVVYTNEETATILVRNLQLATRSPQTKDLVSVTWKAVPASSAP